MDLSLREFGSVLVDACLRLGDTTACLLKAMTQRTGKFGGHET